MERSLCYEAVLIPLSPLPPSLDDPAALQSFKQEFIENNAGRAFEFMVEDINKVQREGEMERGS